MIQEQLQDLLYLAQASQSFLSSPRVSQAWVKAKRGHQSWPASSAIIIFEHRL